MFINRKKDKEKLIETLRKSTDRGHLILVSGKRGYGKSSLVRKVLQMNGIEYIAVESSEEEIKKNITKGLFIKLICRKILAKLPENALKDFLRGSQIEEGTVEIILNGASHFFGFGQTVEKYYQNQNKLPDQVSQYVFDDLHILSICYKFIEYYFSKNDFYLFVENFHLIDQFSLNCIVKLLANNPNGRMTGEFLDTTELAPNEFMCNLSDEIEKSVIPLEKLKKEDLVRSLLGNQTFLKNLIINTYDDSKGNLKQFSLVYKTNRLSYSVDHFDKILLSTLKSLDSSYRMIVISVHCHRGAVPLKLLVEYVRHFTSQNHGLSLSPSSIETLKSMKLLKLIDDSIQLAHDSLSMELVKLNDYTKLSTIANRNWHRMYKFIFDNQLGSNQDVFSNYSMQLYFLSALKDFGKLHIVFSNLLEHLGNQSIFMITPILKEAEFIYFESRQTEKDLNVIEWLIRLYYKCDMLSRVLELCKELKPNKKAEFIGYHLTAESSIGNNHEVLITIKNLINGDNELNFQLACKLNLIRALRSSYEFKKAKTTWLRILKSGLFTGTCFEADFLRFIVLVEHDNYQARIEHLLKASSIYEKNQNFSGQLNVYMDLSRDYLYTGNIENSRVYMDKAIEISPLILFPKFILFNNKSILSILEGEKSREIRFLLESILEVCENVDDKKNIVNNLIIHCIFSDDSSILDTLDSLEKDLILNFNLKSEPDFRLLYNIWQAKIHFNQEISIDYEKLYFSKNKLNKNKKIWSYLLGKSKENPFPEILKRKLYPCFLVNWNIDYYTSLNNFRPEV